VQLPISSPPIVQPEQSPLIVQFQSVPATSNNDDNSSMGTSAAIPTMNIPGGQSAVLQCLATEGAPSNVGLALPTCMHLEGPLSAVPNSQVSSIELGSGVGEASTDSESNRVSIVLLMRSWMGACKNTSTLNVLKKFNVSYEHKSCFGL
jgi:hypothetical protein